MRIRCENENMHSKNIIEKYLNGSLSEQERIKFQEWFASLSTEEAASVFENLGIEIDELDEERLARLEQKLKKSTAKEHSPTILPFSILQVAAILFIICSVGLLFYQNQDSILSRISPVEYAEFRNGAGKHSKHVLADGTVVWLNAVSKIRYPKKFNRKTREVYLEGEAFFEVKRNEKMPFIIHSGSLNTQVLGTSFNVKSYPGEKAIVSVATGRVHVTDSTGKGVYLLAGQRVQYLTNNNFSSILNGDTSGNSSWRNGSLNFNNTSLKEATNMLERYYDIKISIQNPKMEQCMLAGEHTNESLDNVLRSLQFILHFKYISSSKGIELIGTACN